MVLWVTLLQLKITVKIGLFVDFFIANGYFSTPEERIFRAAIYLIICKCGH